MALCPNHAVMQLQLIQALAIITSSGKWRFDTDSDADGTVCRVVRGLGYPAQSRQHARNLDRMFNFPTS